MIERIKDNLHFTTEDLFYSKDKHTPQMFEYKKAENMTCILSQQSSLFYISSYVFELEE